jgi:hypothetical protein
MEQLFPAAVGAEQRGSSTADGENGSLESDQCHDRWPTGIHGDRYGIDPKHSTPTRSVRSLWKVLEKRTDVGWSEIGIWYCAKARYERGNAHVFLSNRPRARLR